MHESGTVRRVIVRAFGGPEQLTLERAAEAHRDIEGRGTQGNLYLTP